MMPVPTGITVTILEDVNGSMASMAKQVSRGKDKEALLATNSMCIPMRETPLQTCAIPKIKDRVSFRMMKASMWSLRRNKRI